MKKLGLACLLLMWFFLATASAAPAVWVETSLVKVKPEALPKTISAATITAARQEFEAFQIVLKDPMGLKGVTATAGSLVGPSTIPASAVRLYRVDLINITTPSDAAGSAGRWPDPLVPAVDDVDGTARSAFPFDVAPNDARAIWVEVLIPATAVAGNYKGSIGITWMGAAPGGVSLVYSLKVRDYTLPSTPILRSYYQLDDQAVCQGHYGNPSCGDNWGPARNVLIDRYHRLALDHRLSLGGGTYGLYPRSQIGAAAWAAFDAQYGPLFDGTAKTRLAGAKLTTIAGWRLPAQLPQPAADFYAHFAAKGWLSRAFFYTADEPPYGGPWSAIPPITTFYRQWVPTLKMLVTTTMTDATAAGVAGSIDLFVPIINYLTDAEAAKVTDKSRLWTYDSCMSHDCGSTTAVVPGWPSAMIDHSAARNQGIGWAAYRYGATGILYWQTVASYSGDAWTSQAGFTGNGDGTLFYPGTVPRVGGVGHTPVASIRLKMRRAGVQAYELLAMVAQAGDPVFAASQARLVAPTGSSFDPASADRMIAARQALGDRLEVLLKPPVATVDAGTVDGGSSPGPVPSASNPIWGLLAVLATVGGAIGAGAIYLLKFKPKA